MHKVRMNFAAVFCALIVGGCSTSSEENHLDAEASKSMHQPKIDKLVAVAPNELLKPPSDTPQKFVPTQELVDIIIATTPPESPSIATTNSKSEAELKAIVQQPITESVKSPISGGVLEQEHMVSSVATTTIVNSNWSTLNKPKKNRAFELNNGEQYRSVINNWLKNAGYKNIEFVLTESDKALLNKKATVTRTYFETLPLAIDKLLKDVVDANNESVSSNGFYLSFTDQKATFYSASQPMFIHQESLSSNDNDIVFDLYLYKGETYESALMRWLNDAGYVRLGKLLSRETQIVFSQTITESEVLRESLDKATTLLLYRARQQALNDERTEVDHFISNAAKASVELHLHMNSERKEAILTSSNQPVVMFNVRPGSLKDNFLEMAKEFGWKADGAHYIADEYHISFGYPIVAEKGNIKPALNKLLADFNKLRGAIVPSTRETYVVMER